MKRDVYLLGVAITLVGYAFLLTEHLLKPRPVITRANWERIRPGMSAREVETILGAPPGYYVRRGCVFVNLYGGGLFMQLRGNETLKEWIGDEGAIQIAFDPHGRAVWGRFVAGAKW